jgi:hypothetical protein
MASALRSAGDSKKAAIWQVGAGITNAAFADRLCKF